MKIILQDGDRYVLRFDKDEDVIAGVAAFMQQQSVKACVFSGVGACSSIEIAHYNSHVKEYRKKPYFEDLEIGSFTGNGAIKDGQPVIHAHGAFGRNDFTVLAGHLFKMVAQATCEIFLTKLEGEMKRASNADYNLNLLT